MSCFFVLRMYLRIIGLAVNDDSEEDEAPLRKKTRSIWDESESEEESDGSWGNRRRRKKGTGK